MIFEGTFRPLTDDEWERLRKGEMLWPEYDVPHTCEEKSCEV